MNSAKHLVVVGGGAAGYFCAVNAARLSPGLQVTILEKSARVLQKVKVSGGGRCNVTHACFEISQMIKRYPRGEKFLKKAFHHFFTNDTIEWFEQRGVQLKTEADGRMFPVTDDSQTIIDCLLQEANKYRVNLRLQTVVEHFNWTNNEWNLRVKASGREQQVVADYLVIACGGFPRAEQFDWMTQPTGHSIVAPVPSLFTFNLPKHPVCELMGVSISNARIKLAGSKLVTEGPVLITHWGLSGPAVLRMSAFAARELAEKEYNYTVIINWMPAYHENSLREKVLEHRYHKPTQKLGNTDWTHLPQRFWEFILTESGVDPQQRWTDLAAIHQNKLIKNLTAYEVHAKGKTTFKEEFVTAGGIQLSEVDPNSMQSRLCPHLFFAGEIVDIDGITGGYNFQNAWTTAFIAARAISQLV